MGKAVLQLMYIKLVLDTDKAIEMFKLLDKAEVMDTKYTSATSTSKVFIRDLKPQESTLAKLTETEYHVAKLYGKALADEEAAKENNSKENK